MNVIVSRHIKIGTLGIVVSLLAIYFIVNQISFEHLTSALLNAQYGYLVPCMLFLVLGLVTRAIRWRLLLSGSISLGRAFSIMNVAYLVNGVLPMRIGEVARIFLTTRLEKPVPALQTASTIIIERLLDLLAVVIMMALALTVGHVHDELRLAGVFGAITALLGFCILIFLARQRKLAQSIVEWFVKHISFLQGFNLPKYVNDFLDGLMPITHMPSLLSALGWTAISWLLSMIAGYILMFAYYPQGDWTATALYIASAAFAIAVPAVPGNIGTYEYSILLALSALGYDQTGTATAFAITVHAVNVFVHVTTGVIGFIQEGISLSQLTAGVQQIQHSSPSAS